MVQSVPKRRHIKFSRRGITQKKEYNIQNTAKVWNRKWNDYFQLFMEMYCSTAVCPRQTADSVAILKCFVILRWVLAVSLSTL